MQTPEERRMARKKYCEDHKEKIAKRNKAYYDLHREEIVKKQRLYRELHKDEINRQQRERRPVKDETIKRAISKLQDDYYIIAVLNPMLAVKIKEEMIVEDGLDFAELITEGISYD